MRSLVVLSVVLAANLVVVTIAPAATAPGVPPAGKYRLGGLAGGFTVNKKRTSVSGLHFRFENGDTPTAGCSSSTFPTGKITVSISKKLKITAAHRGGYTTYIVGRSTPKTSNGITAIPETFKLSTGGTAKGTLYLFWNYDGPKNGSGGLVVGDCSFYPSVGKKR